ncbi:MAG: hypothetical protein ACR2QE_17515 [Acidimicrobiales bacterium]
MRTTIALLIALSLLLVGCGSSSDDDGATATDGSTTAAPDSTVAPETTAAPETTVAPETTAPSLTLPPVTNETVAPPTVTSPPDTGGQPAISPIGVNLSEWLVEAPEIIAAGSVQFDIANGGSFTHELAVARGDSYDTLPILDNGAVDEDTLAADFLGRSDLVDLGQTTSLTLDLEPGNYVLFCNIQVGPNSHAAQGQTLSITVAG